MLVPLSDAFFEALEKDHYLNTVEQFNKISVFYLNGLARNLGPAAFNFIKSLHQQEQKVEFKRKNHPTGERESKRAGLEPVLKSFANDRPDLKTYAACTVARLCSFAQQRMTLYYFADLVTIFLSIMQYQRQLASPDPVQVARIFGHRMQEVFITSARDKITEFYTDEEAEVTKLARHWKTVKMHAEAILDPALFSAKTCPICTERFSPVDSFYGLPQIAPKYPLASGGSSSADCGTPTLALEAYALLLEDDVGELVWFLASLGLTQVNTSTVESLRQHLQERQYERTPHICYLTEVLLPKLLNLANGIKVDGCPFPASAEASPAGSRPEPTRRAGLRSRAEKGYFPKRLGKHGATEWYKLKEVSDQNLPAFATTNFHGLKYMGYGLDRLRFAPHFRDLAPSEKIKLLFRLAREGLTGLLSLHAINRCHGDIKPTNVLVGSPPDYRWLFIEYSGLDRTPAYMDPARLSNGDPSPTQPSDDFYALLLTVLEVILNRGPFADRHDPNLSSQMVEKLYQGSGSYLEKAFGAANFSAGPGLKLFNFFAPMAKQDVSSRTELVFPPDIAAEPEATTADDLTLFFEPGKK